MQPDENKYIDNKMYKKLDHYDEGQLWVTNDVKQETGDDWTDEDLLETYIGSSKRGT